MILDSESIRFLIKEHGVIRDYININDQMNKSSFSLTVKEILTFDSYGRLSTGKNEIPFASLIESGNGLYTLKRGIYLISPNEYLNLPDNLVAIGFSEPSLIRMGGLVNQLIWEPGYKGRPQFTLTVQNEHGIKVEENAKIARLVFFTSGRTDERTNRLNL